MFFFCLQTKFFFLEPHFPHTGNPSPQVLCSLNTIDPDVPPKTELELQQNYL